MTEYARVHSWLKTQYKVDSPRDWLEACVDWVKTENQGRNLVHRDLCNHVLEQWLLSDLTDIGAHCLPANCAQLEKTTLSDAYCLQVNFVLDVSSPYYGQIQKVQGTENENVQVSATQMSQTQEPKAGRMLMLDMTDGAQSIKGMEYQPLPGIDVNMVPGTKVVIQGPVLCRRGVVMLTKNNITVLGGEVESLTETNRPLNVLQKTLAEQAGDQRPNHQMPRKKFEPKPSIKRSPPASATSNRANQRPDVMQPQGWNSGRNQQQGNRQGAVLKSEPDFPDDFPDAAVLESLDDQWGEDDLDLEMLCEDIGPPEDKKPVGTFQTPQPQSSNAIQQSKPTQNPYTSSGRNLKNSQHIEYSNTRTNVQGANLQDCRQTVPMFASKPTNSDTGQIKVAPIVIKPEPMESAENDFGGDLNDSELLMCDAPGRATSVRQTENRLQAKRARTVEAMDSDVQFFDNDEDVFFHCENRAAKESNIGLHTPPYTYLSILQKHWPVSSQQIIRVKAFVSTLLGRLEHNNGHHWSLMVKINDGSAAVDVDLGDEMLTSLIGFTAQQSHVMKAQAKTNKECRYKLSQGIKSCQQSLVQMSCILELLVEPGQSRPVVTKHLPFTQKDVLSLQQRNSAR